MPRTQRILHVIHTYPPESNGGIETYLKRLVGYQQTHGLDPTVLAGREGGGVDIALTEESHEGVRVWRLGSRSRDLEHVCREPSIGQVFEDQLREGGFDLVHLHHWHNVTGDLAARAHRAGVPVVVTLHDFYSACPRFFRMRDGVVCAPDIPRSTCVACCAPMAPIGDDALDNILASWHQNYVDELQHAEAIFALSHDQADYLRAIPQFKRFTIHPVVLPQPDLSPGTEWQARTDGQLHVVVWGGIVEGKGLHILLEACEATQSPERIVVHHYGRTIEGDYLSRLQSLAKRTRLVFHGRFDAELMRDAFPLHDVAVFPSLFRETYGYVVDEAMLLGLPVVVSDLGAPPSRIGGRGLAFPPGDVNALSTILDTFLVAPERLAALRDAPPGPLVDIDAHCEELHQHYAEALGAPRRSVGG